MLSLTEVADATTFLTAAQCRRHLKIDSDFDDASVLEYLASAIDTVEQRTGLDLLAKTWVQTEPCFGYPFRLTRFPVQSVESIEYRDESQSYATLDAAEYQVLAPYRFKAMIWPVESWPAHYAAPDSVVVTYETGFQIMPPRAFQAVKFALDMYYHNRSGEKLYEDALNRLCASLRGY